MMRIFLDTEFNGFYGKLMSMALVPEDPSQPEFYVELEMFDQLNPWVRENVAPKLNSIPKNRAEFQNDLANYLWNCGECVIVADWPDDIRHFCESVITGPGMTINLFNSIKFELDLTIQYESLVPHHALHDARAIRDYYLKIK
jgi:hypothetical protein